MTITADWQTELQGFLSGPGLDTRLGPNRIDGLGVPPMKTRDTELQGQHGSYPSPDFLGPRILIVDYLVNEATTGEGLTTFETMAAAWAPVTNGATLVEFHFRLPGWGHRYVRGRPRGLELVFNQARNLSGVFSVLAEFHALDPTIYTAA